MHREGTVLPQDVDQPFCPNRLKDYIEDIQRWVNHARSSAEQGQANFLAIRKAKVAAEAAFDYAGKARDYHAS